jgi:glycopeptide antibiotics resistance protein
MLLLFSAFATVFLLVFQQQNVTHRKYGLAAVTSALITVSQFIVIKGVSSGDLVDLGFMVVGGVLGVLASMKSHEWMIAWFEKKRSVRVEAYTPGGVDG